MNCRFRPYCTCDMIWGSEGNLRSVIDVRIFTQKMESVLLWLQTALKTGFALLTQLENRHQLCVHLALKSAVKSWRRTRRIFSTITICLVFGDTFAHKERHGYNENNLPSPYACIYVLIDKINSKISRPANLHHAEKCLCGLWCIVPDRIQLAPFVQSSLRTTSLSGKKKHDYAKPRCKCDGPRRRWGMKLGRERGTDGVRCVDKGTISHVKGRNCKF